MDEPQYLHLPPGGIPPELHSKQPFAAVVVIEGDISAEWRHSVSRWLVQSGCLYMMAWGTECSAWDDSVDHANLEAFEYGDIPDEHLVMTTWHDNEPLEEVLWFATNSLEHPVRKIERLILIDISTQERRIEIMNSIARSTD